MKQDRFFTANNMAMMGIMAALMCIAGPLSFPLPFSPVPITLTNAVVYTAAIMLGARRAAVSVLIYLLLGLAGLPVFSGWSGGIAKLAGPTGGYLIGFLFAAWICGRVSDHTSNPVLIFSGCAAATTVLYVFGTLWLSVQADLTFVQALAAGVIPYIPFDLAKMILAIITATELKKRLIAGGIRV